MAGFVKSAKPVSFSESCVILKNPDHLKNAKFCIN